MEEQIDKIIEELDSIFDGDDEIAEHGKSMTITRVASIVTDAIESKTVESLLNYTTKIGSISSDPVLSDVMENEPNTVYEKGTRLLAKRLLELSKGNYKAMAMILDVIIQGELHAVNTRIKIETFTGNELSKIINKLEIEKCK